MKLFKLKYNLTLLQKICLAGLFTALVTVLQKVTAVNYLPALPFVRVSFGGPAMIIFSSIFLGPLFGALVGAGSDLLGYVIFDIKAYPLFPQITAIYALLGFSAYFVFIFVKSIYNKKAIMFIESICFALFLGGVTYYVVSRQNLDLWIKIVAPTSLLILFAGLITFIVLYNKKVKFELGYNVFQISLCSFILEVVVLLLFGSLMKAWAFGFGSYVLIFVCQTIVLFFNVTFTTIVLSLLLKVSKRYLKVDTDEIK